MHMVKWLSILGLGALAGCGATPAAVPRFVEPTPLLSETRPEDPEACYGRGVTTVDATAVWFETICDDKQDATFIRALQRALRVRDLMDGPVNGRLDAATREGLRAFQQDMGVISDRLSVAAGKRLGLLAYERADLPER